MRPMFWTKKGLSLAEQLDCVLPQLSIGKDRAPEPEGRLVVPYQEEFINRALADPRGIFLGEGPPGCGKSRVLASCAAKFAGEGKSSLLVCPNRTALGHQHVQGIAREFHRVFAENEIKTTELGQINVPRLYDKMMFLTPNKISEMNGSQPDFLERLICSRQLLLIDEVHHFAESDDENILKVYGLINDIAQRFDGKTIGVTGTFGRLDGFKPLGKDKPDYRITVKQMVEAGWFPLIRGVELYLDIEAKGIKRIGDEYLLAFDSENRKRYFEAIVEAMMEIRNRVPLPLAAFVSRIKDAELLANMFNERTGLGDPMNGGKGIGVLIQDTPGGERQDIISRIRNSGDAFYSGRPEEATCWGYVTCGVGTEAIDAPPLAVTHLVRRTASQCRQVQSAGRGFRKYPGKDFCLIVDYHLKEEEIKRSLSEGVPLGLLEFMKSAGEDDEECGNVKQGGILVGTRKARKSEKFCGIRIGEEREWIGRLKGTEISSMADQAWKKFGRSIVASEKTKLIGKKLPDGSVELERIE